MLLMQMLSFMKICPLNIRVEHMHCHAVSIQNEEGQMFYNSWCENVMYFMCVICMYCLLLCHTEYFS
jgi:hypothetical protein